MTPIDTALFLELLVALVFTIIAWRWAARRAELYRRECARREEQRCVALAERDTARLERERLDARCTDLLDRFEHLQGQMVDMKREGFVTVEHPIVAPDARGREATPEAVELPTAVEMAIARRGRSAALREQLAAYAHEQLAAEVPADDVARAILTGADTSHLV